MYLGKTSTIDTTGPDRANPDIPNQADRQNIASSISWQVRKPTGITKAKEPNASVKGRAIISKNDMCDVFTGTRFGSKRHCCNAGHQEVSMCRTRGEYEESITHRLGITQSGDTP